MNSANHPPRRKRRLAGAWDTALYIVAIFGTVPGVTNVPGTEDATGVTDLGGGLWVLAMGAWIAVFYRRRLPIVTVSAGLLLAVVGIDYLLLLIGAYHAAITWRPPARTWLGWGVLATVLLFWLREALTPWGDGQILTADSSNTTTIAFSGAIAAISLAFTFGLVVLKRTMREAQGERARADVEHTHAARLGEELSRQSERAQIAREIHDGLTNRLALVSMMSGNLEKAVTSGDPGAAGLALDIQAQARHALGDLRTLIGDLRTEPSAPASQRASMGSLGDLIAATRAAGTKLDALVLINGPNNVHPELDAAIFRLVQEALTNAVKHAPEEQVSLYLDANPGNGVRLRVSNPLRRTDIGGAFTSAKSGTGLTGMRERVAAFRGTTWTGEHNGEFLIDITIPWLTADADFPVRDTALTT